MRGGASGGIVDAAADLLLGGRCAGCTRPGRLLCGACADLVADCAATGAVEPTWPDPVPPGLVPPYAVAEYAGPVRGLLVGHKERSLLALRRPLAGLLAVAVAGAVRGAGSDIGHGPVVLVPVPSRPGSARARGHDPTLRLATGAARVLRRAGFDVIARPLLRSHRGVLDQAGLDAAGRASNLAGSMHCPTELLVRLAARRTHARIVVCDDVVTTGSTLREAQLALEAVGVQVTAAAAVAATRRRSGPSALSPVGSTA